MKLARIEHAFWHAAPVAALLALGVLAAGPGAGTSDPVQLSRVIVVLHTSMLQRSVDDDGTVTTIRHQEHLCGQLVYNLYFECEP